MLTLPRPEGLLTGPGPAYNHYALGIFQPAKVGNFQPAQTGEFSTGVDKRAAVRREAVWSYSLRSIEAQGR